MKKYTNKWEFCGELAMLVIPLAGLIAVYFVMKGEAQYDNATKNYVALAVICLFLICWGIDCAFSWKENISTNGLWQKIVSTFVFFMFLLNSPFVICATVNYNTVYEMQDAAYNEYVEARDAGAERETMQALFREWVHRENELETAKKYMRIAYLVFYLTFTANTLIRRVDKQDKKELSIPDLNALQFGSDGENESWQEENGESDFTENGRTSETQDHDG